MKKAAQIILVLFLIYFLSKVLGRCTGNCQHIRSLKPSVRGNFRNFLAEAKANGYDGVIISSRRSYEEQEYYKEEDPRNASPGTSLHEKRMAGDINFYRKGKLVLTKNTSKSKWLNSGLPQLAKEFGLQWGGNFKGYADNNHFYIS